MKVKKPAAKRHCAQTTYIIISKRKSDGFSQVSWAYNFSRLQTLKRAKENAQRDKTRYYFAAQIIFDSEKKIVG